MTVMFRKIRSIIPYILSSLNVANTCHMPPLPTVFALWYIWIYIHTTYCCNITSNIESTIDNSFSVLTWLGVPDIDPYNGHVRFRRHFDDARFQGKNNVVEDMIVLENIFNFIRWNLVVGFFADEWNAYNLEV